jgi:hypothetical protein
MGIINNDRYATINPMEATRRPGNSNCLIRERTLCPQIMAAMLIAGPTRKAKIENPNGIRHVIGAN